MVDDIISGEPLGPRPVKVNPQPNFCLLLDFDNGEKRIFDMRPKLDLPCYQSLKNADLFSLASIAFGTVVWPGDIDICPDTLYALSVLA